MDYLLDTTDDVKNNISLFCDCNGCQGCKGCNGACDSECKGGCKGCKGGFVIS